MTMSNQSDTKNNKQKQKATVPSKGTVVVETYQKRVKKNANTDAAPTLKQPQAVKRRRASTSRLIVAQTPSENKVVVLPNDVPLRLRERSLLYRFIVDPSVALAARKVAVVASVCFMLLGLTITATGFSSSREFWEMQTAETLDTDSTNISSEVAVPTTAPTLTLETNLPENIVSEYRVSFSTSAPGTPRVKLVNTETLTTVIMPVESSSPNYYSITIQPQQWGIGYYRLSIYIVPIDGSSEYAESSDVFFIGSVEQETQYNLNQNGSVETTDTASRFEFLVDFPRNILADYPVRFVATNAESVTAGLTKIDSSITTQVNLVRLDTDTYKAIIPHDLNEGYYEFGVKVNPANSDSEYYKKSPQFFIGTETQEIEFNSNSSNDQEVIDSTNNEPDTNGATIESADDTILIEAANAENEPIRTIEMTENTTISDENSAPTTQEKPDTISFKLVLPINRSVSGIADFSVEAPVGFTSLQLYARLITSLNSSYVTSAIILGNRNAFVFDSKNLPNGKYEFFAKAFYGGKTVTSESGIIVIDNQIAATVQPVTSSRESITDSKTTASNVEVKLEERPVTTISDLVVSDEINEQQEFAPMQVSDKTEAAINASTGEINELLKRYAIALQSGDESMIKVAETALDDKATELVKESLIDAKTGEEVGAMEFELNQQIDDLKRRVQDFEELREERSSGATAVDTDGDGISDVDERLIYKTDIKNPDSDADGFTDGAEIMRGYDPTSPHSEALIQYRSPKDGVAFIRSDLLAIEQIVRVQEPLPSYTTSTSPTTEPTSTEAKVVAEIRGRGLPNSFVTLYVFSTPTIVTVKTDADGYFVYMFDKELEDGEHEVYVALTDNTGEIIAQSNPFNFVKTAEAFNEVPSVAGPSLLTAAPIEETTSNGYQLAAGAAILALGVILFMLGIMLRSGQPALKAMPVLTETSDDK